MPNIHSQLAARFVATMVRLVACLAMVASFTTQAAPFVPESDDTVVQRLPLRLTRDERAREAALTRAASSDLPSALAATQQAMQRARTHGDPRELGRAQALLAPWWSLPAPPSAVRLLRASILQSQHHFDEARRDLDALIADPTAIPWMPQARLTRAAVAQVQGRLDDARNDCVELSRLRQNGGSAQIDLLARTCLAELATLQGRLKEGSAALAELQATAPRDPWLALLRAEFAQREGDAATAESQFAKATHATATQAPDTYAVAAHADWLLQAGRAQAALLLLQRHGGEADALELRRAIAMKQLNDPGARAQVKKVRERLNAARTRGDAPHAREEAMLALDAEADAARAWALAQANWKDQKEPIDAWLYVRAAMAAGAKAQAQALVTQLQTQGWHDVRLNAALRGST